MTAAPVRSDNGPDDETLAVFRPATSAPTRWTWTLAAVLALGALAIAQLLWMNHVSGQRAIRQLATTNAIRQLELNAALSHLWLMEYLSGDVSVEITEVWQNLDRALEHVHQILHGGGTAPTGDVLGPIQDPELRRKASALRFQLADLRDLATVRHREGESAGVGSDLDQQFDQMFLELLRDSEDLCREMEIRIADSQVRARQRLVVVVVAWIAIVVAAVVVLWRQEKRRRRAERAVRKGQKWLATTLAALGEGVITTDLDGTVVFMNETAQRLTGHTAERATGRHVSEVVDSGAAADGRPLASPVSEVLAGGADHESAGESVLIDGDGRRRIVEQAGAAIHGGDGDLLGAVLVLRDVSERRETEAALKAREDELRHSQKLEEMGRLAGGIAHDVNNYLGAIRGYCEVAAMKGRGQEALTRPLDAAMETAIEASELIRQLLAFSRKQTTRPEMIDVNRVVGKMEGMLQKLLGDDVTLTADCQAELWSVEIDPKHLEQILVNLVVNGRDALPRGGEIRVKTENHEKQPGDGELPAALAPGRYVVLAVADDGIGMTAETQEQIFEPYFTTKSETGSSGLGLATVYGIVQQSGGAIDVVSRPNHGTTFEVYLPASAKSAVARPAPAAGGPAATAPARLLLVEDNDHMRASTQRLLEALGHRVLVAADGEEALRLLAEEQPPLDMMITDVVMPGLSGPELLSRIRAERDGLRCLFISGYADGVILRHGLDQKRTDFLQKPFTAAALSRKIREILSDSAAAAPPLEMAS